jgi:hypothetical protein
MRLGWNPENQVMVRELRRWLMMAVEVSLDVETIKTCIVIVGTIMSSPMTIYGNGGYDRNNYDQRNGHGGYGVGCGNGGRNPREIARIMVATPMILAKYAARWVILH